MSEREFVIAKLQEANSERELVIAELQEKIEELKAGITSREEALAKLRGRLQRMEIVIYSKLTRRQQKLFPKWLNDVDLSKELKLKETFAFPKVGLQAMDRGKWVRLTGTAQSEGLTKEEGADICEYLNSFPENQHQLRNLDSEFRNEDEEARMREELRNEPKGS